MIQPGLHRIGHLLREVQLPWRAIHVAGTNGKGSICAYLSSMLHAAGIRSGRFTSPHLIDRWDSIVLGERVVSQALFQEVEAVVRSRDVKQEIGASEFERLTATAFEIFSRQGVEVAVIEAGMGGALDATNVLKDPLVTVISKVGLDHQSFLGNTLQEIARHKAGIIKPGVPWVVDATNHSDVLEVLTEYADEIGAGPCVRAPGPSTQETWDTLDRKDFEPHQQVNLSCAVAALKMALERTQQSANMAHILPAAQQVSWPGRLQRINVGCISDKRKTDVLLDGAHNAQSAGVLACYVDRHLRRSSRSQPRPPVTWLLAASQGKDLTAMFSPLLKPLDNVVAVEFGPVDGMPWVQPTSAETIVNLVAHSIGPPAGSPLPLSAQGGFRAEAGTDVGRGLNMAIDMAAGRPLVIAGSLYLVADVLRLVRAKTKNKGAGIGLN